MLAFPGEYAFFQKGAERFDAAMRGVPDRVPVYAQLHELAVAELGIPAKEFYSTPELLVPGILEITAKYHLDVACVDYDVYNIEAEALGQELDYSDDRVPDVNRARPLIRDGDDLGKLKTPDFDLAGRCPQVLQMHALFKELTGLEPALQFCAPFSLAANIRGTEQLLLDIYREPSFARELLERLTEEVIAPWVKHQKTWFPNATSIAGSDATASLPLVNLPILQDWVVPTILRLRELCGPDLYVPNWVGERFLKNPEEMLALKLDACPTFLEGQDPDAVALGPARYKEYAQQHNAALVLGVGAAFLAHSSPEAVVERVKHYVEVGGRGGRFSLYLCNLGPTTPRENIRAAVDAVAVCGTYEEQSRHAPPTGQ